MQNTLLSARSPQAPAGGPTPGWRTPLYLFRERSCLEDEGENGCPSSTSQAMSPHPVLRVVGWSSAQGGPTPSVGWEGSWGLSGARGQLLGGTWHVACPAQAACDGLLVEC